MKKIQLMDALLDLVKRKQEECEKRFQTLEPSATTERKALQIQKSLYENAKTFINYAGRGDDIPIPYMRRLNNLLIGEDALREVFEQTEGEERAVTAVYLHTMLFLKKSFLIRYKQESTKTTDPHRQFETNLKISIIEDLLTSYRICFENLGGRKDLII